MLDERKEALRKEIERKEGYLAALEAMPDFEQLVDGTVVALFVTLGRSRPYTYIGFKTGGHWYLTGQLSPNKITSDDLTEWLISSGRRLEGATVLAEVSVQTVNMFDLGEAMVAAMRESRPRRRGSDWRVEASETLSHYGYPES